MDPILERYQALEARVQRYIPTLDTKKFYEAFSFADSFHKGQQRKSGEPYIIHPVSVSCIIAQRSMVFLSGYMIGFTHTESAASPKK